MTTKATHTPGPWTCRRGKRQSAGLMPRHVNSRDGEICILLETPQTEANARLIAAAPDLLAACEAMLRKMEKEGTVWYGDPDVLNASLHEHPEFAARAAIAAARQGGGE